ncbi:phage tail assembly chaperone [Nostoc sp. 3335mG]|nr:phage tail assembly chaperone [Nostoc sp. 3335mG]
MILFAEKAARLAGIAGALAGWRPDEFWRATPAELEAVLAAFAGPQASGEVPPDAATIAALKEQFPDG